MEDERWTVNLTVVVGGGVRQGAGRGLCECTVRLGYFLGGPCVGLGRAFFGPVLGLRQGFFGAPTWA